MASVAALLVMAGPAVAQNRRTLARATAPAQVPAQVLAQTPTIAPQSFDGQAWRRVPVRPGGGEMLGRPPPPRAGRNRCIAVNAVAGAQLYGDRAIELTMRGGRRWRLHLAQDCPALSFYQGFYYQQKKTGQICAGRDAIGARSGGECAIAAIVQVPPAARPAAARNARRRR
ncbi:DUF6491 family protein [Sandarakinorhabdus sp.]|uniref:DUF6491 family protein n=1 Tax=Sandarakinorhabdus sp. TaxID=1916663 RepID=UPI00286E5D9F|nr:DUF6491 family protein [Sandarakinorhabdus sp.]